MGLVKERLIWWPQLDSPTVIEREEALILQGPRPASMIPMPVKGAPTAGDGPGDQGSRRPVADSESRTASGGGGPPNRPERRPSEQLEVVRVPMMWQPKPFSPPLWVYENEDVRIEHQDMNGRQPFYHRNTDVDELSFQVAGPRTLITEIGAVELGPGDFVNIPVGVAHDNWGRQEIHLLFYIKAPVSRQVDPIRFSEPYVFPDWEPAIVPEMISARGGGILISVDERLLLAHAHEDDRQLEVVRAGPSGAEPVGTRWTYKSDDVWIGYTRLERAEGSTYERMLNVDTVQFQLEGQRTLITDLGCVDLDPGDFVRIPAAVAHTSITRDARFLTMYTTRPLKRLVEPTRTGELRSAEQIAALRSGLTAERG